jgi:hypothetical protein
MRNIGYSGYFESINVKEEDLYRFFIDGNKTAGGSTASRSYLYKSGPGATYANPTSLLNSTINSSI